MKTTKHKPTKKENDALQNLGALIVDLAVRRILKENNLPTDGFDDLDLEQRKEELLLVLRALKQ